MCKQLLPTAHAAAADLLRVQSLPAWPAASTLLIRCIHALGGPRGLQHADASVRQISVDFLGLIAAHLFKEALSAADNQAWLAQFASAEEGRVDPVS